MMSPMEAAALDEKDERFSQTLCSRCIQMQDYVNEISDLKSRLPHDSYYRPEYFEGVFCPSSTNQGRCGVCRVLYEAAEKTFLGQLDQIWKVRISPYYVGSADFYFDIYPPLQNSNTHDRLALNVQISSESS